MSCCDKLRKNLSFIAEPCTKEGTTGTGTGMSFVIGRETQGMMCRVDMDCVRDNTNPKYTGKICDYLFYHCEKDTYHFVELKSSSDVAKGIEQLIVTIDMVCKEAAVRIEYPKINGYLVSNNIPKRTPTFNNKQNIFIKKYGKPLQAVRDGAKIPL